MSEVIYGKITKLDERGMSIYANYDNIDRAILRNYSTVQVLLADGRTLLPEQRKKIYALLNDIADWQGDLPALVKRLMKIEFITSRQEKLAGKMFSLSNCDMTTAREFITYLIDFVLEYEVPTREPLTQLNDDIKMYIYACLMRKRCALCGDKADLPHVSSIGMGRNRNEVYQIGMRVLPLCRAHHTEAHTKGVKWLLEGNHLEPIKLTVEIGKKYGLTKKSLERGIDNV